MREPGAKAKNASHVRAVMDRVNRNLPLYYSDYGIVRVGKGRAIYVLLCCDDGFIKTLDIDHLKCSRRDCGG